MPWKIPLFKIYWDKEDIEAIEQVIKQSTYWATGPEIEEFEKKIADYLGIDYCLTFNSGGSALFALMHAYEFGEDDEVIVPSFTFIATAYAPLWVGAKPVFADVEEKTFGLDPRDVKKKITSNTKAIIPIHYGGMPCQITELQELAQKNNLLLIEDAAESFGAKYRNKYVGTFGNSAIFSFCHNKVFTTGEGGCVVTNNEQIYKKVRLFRSYGRKTEGDYFGNSKNLDYVYPGHNFRMSSLAAALGLAQLDKMEKIVNKRRERALYYDRALQEISQVTTPEVPDKNLFCVYQMYTIRIEGSKSTRDKLQEFLNRKGITTKVYFEPVHQYSVFRKLGFEGSDLPITEKLSSQVLSLPLYPSLAEKEMEYIVQQIATFFKKYDK